MVSNLETPAFSSSGECDIVTTTLTATNDCNTKEQKPRGTSTADDRGYVPKGRVGLLQDNPTILPTGSCFHVIRYIRSCYLLLSNQSPCPRSRQSDATSRTKERARGCRQTV